MDASTLTSHLLSASTPHQILSAVSAISAFLRRHPSDQSRLFFSSTFPTLILKLFGFDDPSNPWIDSPALSDPLFDLLSPSGPLFAVFPHSNVSFLFPVERLPEWTRRLESVSDVCPLFRGRVRVKDGSFEFKVGVWEYYLLWFVYYPVCRGGGERVERGGEKRKLFRLENWTAGWSVVGKGSERKSKCGLHLRLLYAYLKEFVPMFGACRPYRSSLLHYSGLGGSELDVEKAEFLVNALVQFWMVDNDFSPVPVGVCRAFGLSFPFRMVVGEAPPSPGLGEVLKLFVKYVNGGLFQSEVETHQRGLFYDGGKRSSALVSYENVDLSWNLLMQRPLYRFILRSFLFGPMGTSIRNAVQVFSVWTAYLEPWKITAKDFDEFESLETEKEGSGNEEKRENERSGLPTGYSIAWKDYVLSNYLFYNSLVVHFLGFAHKFLHNNTETIIEMVLEVLKILTSSNELMDLLKKVDAVYHSKLAGSSSASSDSIYKNIPSITEQLNDWEDGLCETSGDGSFLHENLTRNFRLFSDGEDGAHQLLQLLILRSEPEIWSISGVNESRNLQNLDRLREKMNVLFGTTHIRPSAPLQPEDDGGQQHGHDGIFTPKHPGIGKRTWADVKYEGDLMRRPISDNEVAWFARYLVRLSDFLNEFLGLNRDGSGNEPSGQTYIEVPPSESNSVHSLKDAIWFLLAFIGSLAAISVQIILKFTRERGWRINLRGLASKKVATVMLIFVGLSGLKKAFG